MQSFTIITESTCDLSAARAQRCGIKILPLSVIRDGEVFVPHSTKEYYDYLKNGGRVTTAAANIADYLDAFDEQLQQGRDVLHIGFSSGLSTSFGCAVAAAEELKTKYPDRRVINVDSLGGSMGLGLLCLLCAARRDDGETIEQVSRFAEDIKLKVLHRFSVDDLGHLRRGGRISGAVAVIGSALGIKPILAANDEGMLALKEKVRGNAAVQSALYKYFCEQADPLYADTPVCITHADALPAARELAERVLSHGKREIIINDLGAVMGAHAGPGTLALFFIGRERE